MTRLTNATSYRGPLPTAALASAENHAPKVNQPWSYALRGTDAGDHPLSGRVDIEFGFGQSIVGR